MRQRDIPCLRWTDLSCKSITLVGKRHLAAPFHVELVFADHVHKFNPGQDAFGRVKRFEISIGLITRLTARRACSTILLRYLT